MRIKPGPEIEANLLHACRRRCCICFYLNAVTGVRKGQIAHLDGNSSNSSVSNLVWLCFEHHDEYDSRTSQSKGLTRAEVRNWREKLIQHFLDLEKQGLSVSENPAIGKEDSSVHRSKEGERRAWRFPLWQVADEPELFAYTARNGADGVCAIERVDLPDQRIVIICTQVAGNPGQSVTNSAETICDEICERFEIPLDQLVWLETYDHAPTEWSRVVFNRNSEGRLTRPTWYPLRDLDWHDLRLRPKGALERDGLRLVSNVEKLFPWPNDVPG